MKPTDALHAEDFQHTRPLDQVVGSREDLLGGRPVQALNEYGDETSHGRGLHGHVGVKTDAIRLGLDKKEYRRLALGHPVRLILELGEVFGQGRQFAGQVQQQLDALLSVAIAEFPHEFVKGFGHVDNSAKYALS